MPFCTGGTISYTNGRRIHKFTADGTLTVILGGLVEYLLIAGGGSGQGGGGGAAGWLTGWTAVTPGDKTIVVGDGAIQSGGSYTPAENSTFNSLTALAGVRGATWQSNGTDGPCGSGAAVSNSTGPYSGGVGSVGYNGGGVTWGAKAGGGGGGGGAAGGTGDSQYGGAGGAGFWSSLSGSATQYCGGGGGGGLSGAGAGGAGGGGTDGTPATANTGGGGGGSYGTWGTSGGSGLLIVSYVPTGQWAPQAFYNSIFPVTGAGGIASAETFGSGDSIASNVSLSGNIVSLESFGTPGTTISGQILSGSGGIASEEGFGDWGHLWYLGIAMEEELATQITDSVTETVNVQTEKTD